MDQKTVGSFSGVIIKRKHYQNLTSLYFIRCLSFNQRLNVYYLSRLLDGVVVTEIVYNISMSYPDGVSI